MLPRPPRRLAVTFPSTQQLLLSVPATPPHDSREIDTVWVLPLSAVTVTV